MPSLSKLNQMFTMKVGFPARVRLREALTTPSPRTDNAKIKPPQMHRTEAPAFDISMHFY